MSRLARLLGGVLLALTLAGAAMASPRPAQIGDVYRYSSETQVVAAGGPQPHRQSNRFTYDLEILDVRPDGLTLRYVIDDVQVADDRDPNIGRVGRSYVGIPFEFETDGYAPARLVNWQAARSAYFARLDPALRETMTSFFAGLEGDPKALAEQFSGDLKLFSGFQSLETPNTACRARSDRTDSGVTYGTGAGRYRSRSSATLSGDDGWVIEAAEQRTDEKPDGSVETTTTKVRRLSPQVFC